MQQGAMKTVKVAILGLGTVGSGVYKLIQKRADVMEKTIGAQMEVKKILVRNMNKKREGVDASLLTDNWNDIIEDDEIQIVIEVMGGIEPAKTMNMTIIMSMMRKAITKIRMQQRRLLPMKSRQKKHL